MTPENWGKLWRWSRNGAYTGVALALIAMTFIVHPVMGVFTGNATLLLLVLGGGGASIGALFALVHIFGPPNDEPPDRERL